MANLSRESPVTRTTPIYRGTSSLSIRSSKGAFSLPFLPFSPETPDTQATGQGSFTTVKVSRVTAPIVVDSRKK